MVQHFTFTHTDRGGSHILIPYGEKDHVNQLRARPSYYPLHIYPFPFLQMGISLMSNSNGQWTLQTLINEIRDRMLIAIYTKMASCKVMTSMMYVIIKHSKKNRKFRIM